MRPEDVGKTMMATVRLRVKSTEKHLIATEKGKSKENENCEFEVMGIDLGATEIPRNHMGDYEKHMKRE